MLFWRGGIFSPRFLARYAIVFELNPFRGISIEENEEEEEDVDDEEEDEEVDNDDD